MSSLPPSTNMPPFPSFITSSLPPSTKSTPRPPAQSIDDIMIDCCVCMDQDMLIYAAETALQATRLHDSDGEIAAHMKAQFELIYGQSWYCVVNEETTPDSPEWCGAMYVSLDVGPKRIILYKIMAPAAGI